MTQEITVRRESAVMPDQASTGTDLRLWAEQATAAAQYAEVVCSTSMAPAQYRGKPAEATAAILAGAELGFSPMASLRAFDNISGTPAPKAMTLRAVVQAAGHDVRIDESTDDRAVVSGRRKGSTEWQTSVWDVARAQQLAQFKSNPNYKTNRAQMLAARATAEVCRWIGADAIMGMPYAAERADRVQHLGAHRRWRLLRGVHPGGRLDRERPGRAVIARRWFLTAVLVVSLTVAAAVHSAWSAPWWFSAGAAAGVLLWGPR